MRRRVIGLAMVMLLLAACTAAPASTSTAPYQLYFVSELDHGSSIVGQPYTPDTTPTPEQLIHALLSGPTQEDLRSPFPAGLVLHSCTLQQGHLTVDFSEQYSGLTDISLTLANYCVVLTVCQLEEIESVEITVAGQPLRYRSHQILTPDDPIPTGESPRYS